MNQPSFEESRKLATHAFTWALGYLFLLLVVSIFYGAYQGYLPSYVRHPFGGMPLSVPWFGALGGIMASLHGIYLHNKTWDYGFDFWHRSSAVVGAAMGVATYLVLQFLGQTTGNGSLNHSSAIYPLGAFLIGYNENRFQELLRRAGDAIFGTKDTAGAGTPPPQSDHRT